MRRLSWRLDLWLFPAGLLALVPILSLLRPGLPNTADGQVHLLRTLQVADLLRTGILYPRWAPDFYLGYGYPFFNFYAPGAHLLAGVAALSGLGVLRGMIAVQVLALLAYPTGAYLAARRLLAFQQQSRGVAPAALASAVLYLYAPLRFRELFIQGNLSQLVALGVLPWCAWLLAEAVQRGSWRWAIAAGFALAGLVYAHHPSAFLAFPMLGLYAVVLAVVAGRGTGRGAARRRVLMVAVSFLLGGLLSAPFWLPSLAELGDVSMTGIQAGMFNARLNLTPASEILSPALIQDDAALNPPTPHSLGTAQAAMALLGLLAILSRWAWAQRPANRSATGQGASVWSPERRPALNPCASPVVALAASSLLLLSLGLMLPVAAPLWERLPLARFIAFPWRLLGPALLWAAFLGGIAVQCLPERFRPSALLALLLLVPLSVAPYLFPRPFAPAREPVRADIARYELAGGARGTASANEYLPRWVSDPDPPAILAEAMMAGLPLQRLDSTALPPGSRAQVIAQEPLTDAYRLDLPAAANVRIRRFYFPGWRATVDGEAVAAAPDGAYGLVEVPVPAGSHELRLTFGSTPPRQAGGLLALAGMAAAIGLWIAARCEGTAADIHPARPSPADTRHALAWSMAVILAVTVAKAGVIEPHTRWFRYSSAGGDPPGIDGALHARFTNGIELIGYSLGDPEPRQESVLPVRLYWRTLEPQSADFRPYLHLDARTGEVTWANQTKLHAGDKPSRDWPVGFYVVDDYRLEIPGDTPPVSATVVAGLLDQQGERVRLATGEEQVAVATVRVRERQPLAPVVPEGFAGPYRLGDEITLVGCQATVGGEPALLELTLYWQAVAPVAVDYTAFVHVLDAGGRRVAQDDGPPLRGWYPTSAWAPGQVIADRRRIPLPADASSPDLRVAVGLYTLMDGSRLPAYDRAGVRQAEERIVLPAVGKMPGR